VPAWRSAPEFDGKTWIFWAKALVLGGLAGFSLLFGPLIYFGVMRDVHGRHVPQAGIAMTIIGIPLLLVTMLALYNIVARRRPILGVYRDGVALNQIGASSLDRIPLVPGLFRTAWLIVSLQGFRQQLAWAPWETLQSVNVSGLPLARSLTIVACFYRSRAAFDLRGEPFAGGMTVSQVEFIDPVDYIARTINRYARDPEARSHLPPG
jgi:hypothetical protein